MYLTQSKNPTLNNIIKNGVVDNLELQKYLLPTGLLQDSVQQSLGMIVTDGGFNDAAVRRELDLKYPSIMKKPNSIDVVFKDKIWRAKSNNRFSCCSGSRKQNKWEGNFESNKWHTIYERYWTCRGFGSVKRWKKINDNNNDNFTPFLPPLPQRPTPPPSPPDGGDGVSDDNDDGIEIWCQHKDLFLINVKELQLQYVGIMQQRACHY